MIRMVSAIVCVMVIYRVQPIAAAELRVAPSGVADAPGTAERPLADVEQARDVIRDWKKNGKFAPGGVTVWVHGGDYIQATAPCRHSAGKMLSVHCTETSTVQPMIRLSDLPQKPRS